MKAGAGGLRRRGGPRAPGPVARRARQPLPADHDEALARVPHPIPICADEACHTRADLDRLLGKYDAINIKLDKAGGLTEALELAAAATARGFKIMVGCM